MIKTLSLATFVMMLLTGCSMPDSTTQADAPRYYVLTASEPSPAAARSRTRLTVMPVLLPGYLDRAQIVTRSGGVTKITVSDYDRWGEDLALGIARVAAASLSGHGISAVPWQAGTPDGPKLRLEIRSFEGEPGGFAVIDAGWALLEDGKESKTGSFAKRCAAGSGYDGLVASLSLLVQDLGGAIASSLP